MLYRKVQCVLAINVMFLSFITVNKLSQIMSADNVKVYRECPEDSVHFLVLTDIAGNKTFATCITFYKPYIIELVSFFC